MEVYGIVIVQSMLSLRAIGDITASKATLVPQNFKLIVH